MKLKSRLMLSNASLLQTNLIVIAAKTNLDPKTSLPVDAFWK